MNTSNKKYKSSEMNETLSHSNAELHVKTERSSGYELEYNHDNHSPGLH
jgi:hypothetical protein